MNTKVEEKSRKNKFCKSSTVCHTVVGGVIKGRLDPEDMDLYRFMVGGMQAK
ncbi:MAG: hypothetical protein WBL02_01235 [Methanomethylovorans sp.]|uniref:hypothetical protein n=1 Tax=Methanomethylovorans sp. TaxID=2758717 RepID=UPI000A938ACD|nr:hypothetical protein [Methanomethylovorans sp.]